MVDVHVVPPGAAVATNPVTGDPPSMPGVHRTVAAPSVAVAATAVGAPGIVNGTTGALAADGALDPTAFVATTVTVCDTPFVRPMMVHVVVGVEHVAPPGVAVAV